MKTLAMRLISKLIVTIGILLLISGSTVSYVRPIRSSWTVKQNNQFSSEFLSIRNILAESVRLIQSIRHSSRDGEGFNLEDLAAKLSGNISSIDYNNYTYKNVAIEGNVAKRIFKGKLNVAL